MDAAVGSRVLGEVQEVTLEEVLAELRTSVQQASNTSLTTRYKLTHIPELDSIQARHLQFTKSSNLSLSGRHLPLLYHLLSHILSPPQNYTVLLIDIDGRFDPTRLTCTPPTSLRHLYIQRPARSAVGASAEHVRNVVADAEEFMLHGEGSAQSRGREWWGTVVVGAVVAGGGGGGGGLPAGDVAAGWKGWLKVEREAVGGFAMGMSVSDARARREERQKVVDKAGWAAESPWGGFVFHE